MNKNFNQRSKSLLEINKRKLIMNIRNCTFINACEIIYNALTFKLSAIFYYY